MKRSSTQAKPCTDTNCRGQHEPTERMAMASLLCKERGAQFTKLRRRILELLWEGNRPMLNALTTGSSKDIRASEGSFEHARLERGHRGCRRYVYLYRDRLFECASAPACLD